MSDQNEAGEMAREINSLLAQLQAAEQERDAISADYGILLKESNAVEQERDQWKAKFTERSDEYLASIRKERQLQERVSALQQERDALREAQGRCAMGCTTSSLCPIHGDSAAMIEQFCQDLNAAHDELVKAQGGDPVEFDWPNWSGPANSIRWAEKHLGKPLSKTSLRRAAR